MTAPRGPAQRGSSPDRRSDLGAGLPCIDSLIALVPVVGVLQRSADFLGRAFQLTRFTDEDEARTARFVAHVAILGVVDIVLDSGCLHSLIGGDVRRYKQRLLGWLAPGSEYVLGHFGKRHALDWRPVGPARRTRREIVGLFAPELSELEFEEELMTGIGLPIGPTVLGQGFRFRRAG